MGLPEHEVQADGAEFNFWVKQAAVEGNRRLILEEVPKLVVRLFTAEVALGEPVARTALASVGKSSYIVRFAPPYAASTALR